MKYFTKKAIITKIEDEKISSVRELQNALSSHVSMSLKESLVGSDESLRLINGFHTSIESLEKQAIELANLYKSGDLIDSMGRYETVMGKLGYFYNPTNLIDTARKVVKSYITGHSGDEYILEVINPKAHFEGVAMGDRIDEVKTQYNTLLRNLIALPSAKQCVKYLESIGYDPLLFTHEESEQCTALVVPLNADLLIGMKKRETTETPEEGI